MKTTKRNPLTNITIAIDVMGGDQGPPVTIPAALAVLARHPHLHLILVGHEEVLQAHLTTQSYDTNRLTLHHASEQVGMDEAPAQALRTKKDSSMRVAINLVKEQVAQACVSAGNTGALMATARFVLKTLPGIDRPAIISSFPTMDPHKKVRMLDLGANVDTTPDILVQFAVMGSALVSALDNIANPKVCLLNIGEEDIKGNELVKQTAQRLSEAKMIHYAGYIEADALYKNKADVIVCDGFVGNVTLKSTEGAARFIGFLIKEAFMRNLLTKIVGMLAKPVLKSFIKRIDPSRYNGATFIGLRGVVIKSHGSANKLGFENAIEEALICVTKNIPERISTKIAQLQSQLPSE